LALPDRGEGEVVPFLLATEDFKQTPVAAAGAMVMLLLLLLHDGGGGGGVMMVVVVMVVVLVVVRRDYGLGGGPGVSENDWRGHFLVKIIHGK